MTLTFHEFIALIPAVFVLAWVLCVFTKCILDIFYNIGRQPLDYIKKDD